LKNCKNRQVLRDPLPDPCLPPTDFAPPAAMLPEKNWCETWNYGKGLTKLSRWVKLSLQETTAWSEDQCHFTESWWRHLAAAGK